MATFTIGDVVLVSFPFSDLSQNKKRPAVVIKNMDSGDFMLSMITSQGYNDPMAMPIAGKDITSSGLGIMSFVRPTRLFVANTAIIQRKLGKLSPQFIVGIKDSLVAWLSE